METRVLYVKPSTVQKEATQARKNNTFIREGQI